MLAAIDWFGSEARGFAATQSYKIPASVRTLSGWDNSQRWRGSASIGAYSNGAPLRNALSPANIAVSRLMFEPPSIVWLRQHANEFGLTKEDGNPNEQGIEEVAKIANWDTKGGAPKTPGAK